LNPSRTLAKPYKYPLENEKKKKKRKNIKKHTVKRPWCEGSKA
jgi:hypothetical protein